MKKNHIDADKILFVSALVAFIILGLYLYDDQLFFKTRPDREQDAIGFFVKSQNDVRRRTQSNFLWRPAEAREKVFQGDNIFTGPDGQAQVQLNDGTLIDIKPNSLVVLKLASKEMELEFKSGGFLAGLMNRSLRVKDGEQEFEINGKARVDATKSDSGESNFKVLEGEVKVKKGQQAVHLKSGETVALSQPLARTKVVEKQPPMKKHEVATIELKPISSDSQFWFHDQSPLKLSWKSKGPFDHYQIEFSQNMTFDQIEQTVPSSQNRAELSSYPRSGQYFWRVRGFDKKEEIALSKPSPILFRWIKTPTLQNPKNGDVLTLQRNRFGHLMGTSQFEVQWENPQSPLLNELQISTKPQFAKLLVNLKTKNNDFTTDPLPEGRYYFRVRSLYPFKKISHWSETVTAEVIFAPVKIFLPSPRLSEFQERFLIHLNAEGKLQGPFPQLKWTKIPESKEYQIDLSRDSSFKTVEQSHKSEKNQYHWTQALPGSWFYRVQAIAKTNEPGEMSSTHSIEIITDSPQIQPLQNLTLRAKSSTESVGPQPLQLQWKKNTVASQYIIEMSKDAQFSNPVSHTSRAPASHVTLPEPGDYFFRVKSLDATSKAISGYSPTKHMTFAEIPVLDPPTTKEPRDEMTFFYQVNSPVYIWLGWQKVHKAGLYHLEISKDPQFQLVIIADSTDKDKYLIKQKLPNGKFYWRIKALTKDQKTFSDWSKTQGFLVVSDEGRNFEK